MPSRAAVLGMALLAAASGAASAQPGYQPYPAGGGYQTLPPPPSDTRWLNRVWLQPSAPRPNAPPAWNYDPYTNGTVPAPQGGAE